MSSPRKPWWQQATALVSLGTGGAITGFAFAHGTPAQLASPASVPVTLTALDQAAQPTATQVPSDESVVRSAIVKVASYYARLAQSKTPAEMEALIWQQDSASGADHGQSCAAFASMTLQLGAQLAGKQSWVTGGSTYPWPLHDWVDARVDPNSGSLSITSVLQDAESHQRWHALGDGYQPLPGDWVLFDNHVEVVTQYEGGVLSTIGGDSLPNFSVNSHAYSGALSSHGVEGFVSNGDLPAATTAATSSEHASSGGSSTGISSPAKSSEPSATQPQKREATPQSDQQAEEALAAIPGTTATQAGPGTAQAVPAAHPAASASAEIPGVPGASPSAAATPKPAAGASSSAAAPEPATKAPTAAPSPSASAQPYQRHQAAASTGAAPGTATQRAFIDQIAPGAMAAQRTYGVPAAVTIAQAIDESAWGQSTLASEDHNLFGIKGTGPAGSVSLPTQEVYGGETVSVTAQFRAYDNVAQSIEDHGQLIAQSGAYTVAMSHQNSPNSFANALTGVYATDPGYGASLIGLMRQYNLYRYDASATSASTPAATASPKAQPHGATQSHPASQPKSTPQPRASATQHAASTSPSAKATSPSRSAPATAPSPQASAPAPAAKNPGAPTPAAAPATTPTAAPAPATTPTTAPATSAAPAVGSQGTTTPGGSGTAASGAASQTPAGHGTSQTPAGQGSDGTPASNGSATGGSLGAAEIPGTPAGPSSTPSSSNPASPGSTAATSSTADSGSGADASTSAAVQSSARAPDATLTAVYRPAPAAQDQHHAATPKKPAKRKGPTVKARRAAPRYQPEMPPVVKNALLSTARKPLARAEFVYRDIAASEGVSWKILAACDWMQCDAHPRYSPVRGEKLGSANPDGTVFHTKSEALTQTARDLVLLAGAVYGIDLTVAAPLSVPELANVFAAYRWGGLLRQHSTSAMEFPYSVQGLTDQFLHMRWPKIADPNAPDKPGSRYRRAFGAVPVVLSLDYPAIVLLSLRPEKPGDPMVRILVLLLGTLSQRRRLARYQAAVAGAATGGWAGHPGPRRPADSNFWLHEPTEPPTQVLPPVAAPPPPAAPPQFRPPGPGRRRWIPRWVKWSVFVVLVGLVFRRAVAAVVVTALSATLHFFGLNVHLPHIKFGWPWQAASVGTSTNIDVGPWVLQKIEGISKPALGTENFNFVFTHKVSKNVGPWPCWYSSTFYAVGHASATVDLNPGPSWWTPGTGHYQLRVVSRPAVGRPGGVSITMVLPPPQLPQNVHDVTIDNTLSKPLSTDHSWTYPGLGCGALIKPQFAPSVVYAQAQQEAFDRVSHLPSVNQPLIRTAESQAAQIIRDNFIQPTVNALGYTLDSFTLRWASSS